MTPNAEIQPKKDKKFSIEKLTLLIGVISSIVTISLTIYNARTKTLIDEAEVRLKSVQADIAAKAEQREAFKEKVSRYTWIRGLFPDLIDEKDEKKRNFTISLVRLSLDPKESEDLFAALQASSSKELQAIGQSGISAIQNEQATELAGKINLINAGEAEVRKRTVKSLLDEYRLSSRAITIVLKLYDEDKIDNLSSSGVINGIVFLKGTDVSAWDKQQIKLAEDVIIRVRARNPGPQTQSVVKEFESMLAKIKEVQKV